MRWQWLLWMTLLPGCGLLDELLSTTEENCDPRTAYFPDADGDGLGDPNSAMYLGCEAPEGYVTNPPRNVFPDTDATDGSDTDATDAPDTDVDTDATDAVDSDATDAVDSDANDPHTDI